MGKDTVQPWRCCRPSVCLIWKLLFEQTLNSYTLGILPTKEHGVLVKLCLISSELTILTKNVHFNLAHFNCAKIQIGPPYSMCLGYKKPFKYHGNERKSKRPGIFCLEKGKQKGKVIRMHGKEEEGIIPLRFVIKYEFYFQEIRVIKRNYKEIKKGREISLCLM